MGLYWDNGETAIVYWGYIIVTVEACRADKGYTGDVSGLYWDNGKENGNYRDYRAFIGVIQGINIVPLIRLVV